MTDPSLETISEATQVGAGEFYQIFSEKMQGNYPVTSGLMPWVFKRHWPVIAIQTMDWFGHAAAPYYFLKRTYEKTHIAIDLPRLLWKSGESIDLHLKVTNADPGKKIGKASVTVYDDAFKLLSKEEKPITVAGGTSVTDLTMAAFKVDAGYKDRFLFILAELKDATGKLISRSYYFPRVLAKMDEKAFYDKYTTEPINWITLEKGPFLKPIVQKTTTELKLKIVGSEIVDKEHSKIRILVNNTGKTPAFMTKVDITGTKRAFTASDNYEWLGAGESREITIDVLWREPENKKNARIEISAWNAQKAEAKL
jgi:beta-mannosidase